MRFVLFAVCLFPIAATANPSGGTVTNGSATISSSGSTLTVNSSTSGTVINWNSFSISTGETTRFNQPSASSVTLNRVTGPSASSINGSLQSNGQVFLVNPNGIVFGAGSQVNAAGFIASTLDISDADFLAGNLHFTGTSGSIVNNGSIVASDYFLALIAPNIQSTGTLQAGPPGIALVAASPATILTAPGFVISNVITGFDLGGTGSMQVSGTVSPANPWFIVDGTATFSPGGSPSLPPPLPPLPVVGPGTAVINPNPGTSSGVINWTNFNIGTSSSITIVNAGGATIGNLSSGTTAGGSVTIQGTLTQAGPAPAVTTTGVALNLEKREFSF